MTDHAGTLAAYFRLMNANGAAHVYREAVRAGVLDALRAGPAGSGTVAERCGLAGRPVALLLEVLASLGLVEAEGDRAGPERPYRLTPLAEALLGGSYRELGDPYWSHLASFLATGAPLAPVDDPARREAFYRTQAAALAWMLAPAAEAAAQALDAGRELAGRAILDVGAGSAIWSLTLARHAPGATVTAVDWPGVLPVAEATAGRLGLAGRLTLLPGDYHRVPFPDHAFDRAVLGNVTHLETPGGNRALLARVARALRPGGQVLVLDVLPGQEAGDVNRTLYALGLALRTPAGRVYTPEELSGFLAAAGFGPARLVSLPVPPYAVGMLVAARA
jgi:SAM-dependent methyltransferase